MKKMIALLLALVMVMGLATVVSAETYNDMSSVAIKKTYTNANNGINPEETFNFTIELKSVENAGVAYDAAKQAMPTVASVKFAEGEATATKDIAVTLPTYNAVGIYTYEIKETAGNTAGVTYHADPIKLVVTVIEQDGKVRVAAIHTETSGKKADTIVNVYESGALSVSKEVIGNLGDREKEFDVTVTFTAPARETVGAAISYVEDGTTKTIAKGWTGTKEVTIALKHDETIKFTNIPEGVTYAVKEADYTGEGYEAAVYAFSDEEKCVDAGVTGANEDTVKITNKKDVPVDTGITMDTVPFVVMIAIAVIGLAAFTAKKRVQE